MQHRKGPSRIGRPSHLPLIPAQAPGSDSKKNTSTVHRPPYDSESATLIDTALIEFRANTPLTSAEAASAIELVPVSRNGGGAR
jgi:hypothetical protein